MLNNETINKIAAGEVIIRPVSVVKELVENAIDAGADQIAVIIEAGGKNRISVRDNGCGIAYNEIPLAFKRHATSKLSAIEDLESIDSLGFRGEALSSVSAVAKVQITTRYVDEEVGSQTIFEGGKLINQRVCAYNRGTEITVRELFYNTPARRKHLEKDKKEETIVRDLVEKIAVSHPGIRFQVSSNGRKVLDTPGTGKVLDVVKGLYGVEVADNLIALDYENKPMKLAGFVGNLKTMRSHREDQVFFINGRYIKNSRLAQALDEAYEGYSMKHQHPLGIIFIELPGRMLDINIHPAKTEIKILNESLVCLLFKQGIRETLRNANLIVDVGTQADQNQKTSCSQTEEINSSANHQKEKYKIQSNGKDISKTEEIQNQTTLESVLRTKPRKSTIGGTDLEKSAELVKPSGKADQITDLMAKEDQDQLSLKEKTRIHITQNSRMTEKLENQRDASISKTPEISEESEVKPREPVLRNQDDPLKQLSLTIDPLPVSGEQNRVAETPVVFAGLELAQDKTPLQSINQENIKQVSNQPVAKPGVNDLAKMKIVGQLFNVYILLEGEKEIYLLDQHAAHEAFITQELLGIFKRGDRLPSQGLMTPIPIKIRPKDLDQVEMALTDYQKLGYDCDVFGENTLLVRSVPVLLGEPQSVELLKTMIDENLFERDDNNLSKTAFSENAKNRIITMACKAAIKGGQQLTHSEISKLLENLMALDNPYTCPHGRPIIMRLKEYELMKLFKRVV
ncbi:MAG: DNA mismatch repair endonuclease MutL [Acetobacterium sp.]|nr:DNA mismatch repair endonuclease MutL [Bacillota bacterium]MCG2729932.1 DNA mismatch repair endonuclease MutL [Acetobacterium sp.]